LQSALYLILIPVSKWVQITKLCWTLVVIIDFNECCTLCTNRTHIRPGKKLCENQISEGIHYARRCVWC
jgi:hypothetical protein